MVDAYDRVRRDVLDNVAPMRTRTIPVRVDAHWYNETIREEKQRRRQAERRWLRTKSTVDRQSYKAARLQVQRLIEEAKCSY